MMSMRSFWVARRRAFRPSFRAFSSEVDAGSREVNAPSRERASVVFGLEDWLGLTEHKLGILLITPMIIGTGVLLRHKGALSRRGLIAATAATLVVATVMFVSQ